MDITIRPFGAAISTEVDLNDETTFIFDWVNTQWGEAQQPDPEEQMTQAGSVIIYPHPEAWKRRELKIVGAILCTGHNDKRLKMSTLTQLFQGIKTIRRHGWEMDVAFMAPREMQESTGTPLIIRFEVVGYATPPFWRLVDSLSSIQWSERLYADYGIPSQEAMPAYLFGVGLSGAQAIAASPGTGSHLTITNWGTGFVYPEITFTSFSPGIDVYIKGSGRFRVKLASGKTTITATDRLYLAPGSNGIRFENSAGTAIDLTSYTTMRVDFGATKYRFK